MSDSYMNSSIRARMYDRPWQRWAWVAAVLVSFGLLAPPLFFIAAKKRVVALWVPAAYAVFAWGTPLVASILGNGKNWSGAVLAFTWLVAVVHAAIVDMEWKRG
ncbi:hypothetical protein [Streptomyces luteogriseus]|uniref:hypothetical protein n=1 Tax=Streptomyces luteogriseus TaxID=68233 RepID=UPI0037B9BFAC